MFLIKIFEIVKLAISSIWGSKVRSFLTMLGVIIGVFAVVILIASVNGVKHDVVNKIFALGARSYFILPGETTSGGAPSPLAAVSISNLRTSDAELLKEKATKTADVSPAAFQTGVVTYKKEKASPFMVGTWPNFVKVRRYKLDKGRNFNQKEVDDKTPVVVISNQVTKDLFNGKNPVGKKVTINGKKFKVVGTLKKIGTVEIGINFDDIIYIPLSTLQDIFKNKEISRILAEAKPGYSVQSSIRQAKSILKKDHKKEDFTVFTQDQIIGTFKSTTDLLTLLLSAVAAVSLLISGIGIMNIMLVSVVERTKEIGLRKAVGATSADILYQFMTEAIILSVVGSLIGLVSAVTAAYVISKITLVTPIIEPYVIYMAAGFGIGVGIVFGVAPAFRASRLDPIVALHHE
jgi:putative ABC transport system permease protein